jgi:hypothetical protein
MGFTPPKRVVADSLVKHLNLTPPAVLYHYTTSRGAAHSSGTRAALHFGMQP